MLEWVSSMIDVWIKYGEHVLYDNQTKKFEDTNWVIRSREVKKDRQYNDQKENNNKKEQTTEHYTDY